MFTDKLLCISGKGIFIKFNEIVTDNVEIDWTKHVFENAGVNLVTPKSAEEEKWS